MRIIYATKFEGLNRISRGWEILRYLRAQRHELFVIGSGRAFHRVEREFRTSFAILYPPPNHWGEIDPEEVQQKNRSLEKRIERFQADLMILDGESFAAQLFNKLRGPVLSIDHLHYLDKSIMEIPIPPAKRDLLIEVKQALKDRGYWANKFLLPLFFNPSPTSDKVEVIPTLIPSEVIDIPVNSEDEAGFLAYYWEGILQQTKGFNELEEDILVHVPLQVQKRIQRAEKEQQQSTQEPVKKHVEQEVPKRKRGTIEHRKGKKKLAKVVRRRRVEPTEPPPEVEVQPQEEFQGRPLSECLPAPEQHVEYIAASSERWPQDIAHCKAVVLTGDMIPIAEAIHLKKPMLLIPREDRIDQWIQAHYIEKMGFGEVHSSISRDILEGFIERLPQYKEKLQEHTSPGNKAFFDKLSQEISVFAKGKGKGRGKGPQRQGGPKKKGPKKPKRTVFVNEN